VGDDDSDDNGFVGDFGDNALWLFQQYHDSLASTDPKVRQLALRGGLHDGWKPNSGHDCTCSMRAKRSSRADHLLRVARATRVGRYFRTAVGGFQIRSEMQVADRSMRGESRGGALAPFPPHRGA
jgi:hypothetical protein